MRRTTGWFGLYVALLFALFGTGTSYMFDVLMVVHPEWHTLLRVMGWVVWGAFLPFGYVFPDGRFVPRWTRWLVLGWATSLLISFMQTTHDGPPSAWMATAVLITIGGAVGSQIYRYQRRADPVQRQQSKWILWAIMVIAVTFTITLVVNLSLPIGSDTTGRGMLLQLFNRATGVLTTSLLPLAVGVAILRYRLWDVDILINRTLVYGALTATLVLVYLGSILVLQTLLRPLVGADSELATVASTLAIAALFQPLRRRLQASIDRRFYRRKYDSQRVLESFAARLRNETDLETLTQDVVQVVQETLQPTHVSLWLRDSARYQSKQQR